MAAAVRSQEDTIRWHWPQIYQALAERHLVEREPRADRDCCRAIIATVAIETARQFRPVREAFYLPEPRRTQYLTDLYEWRQDLGNTQSGDGARYAGNGDIQLTGRANHRYYGSLIGLDLEGHPELLDDPLNSARVLAAYCDVRGVAEAAWRRDWREVRRRVQGADAGLLDLIDMVEQLGA